MLLGSEDDLSLNLVFANERFELVELHQFDIDIEQPLGVALHLLKHAGEGRNVLAGELRRSERADVELLHFGQRQLFYAFLLERIARCCTGPF